MNLPYDLSKVSVGTNGMVQTGNGSFVNKDSLSSAGYAQAVNYNLNKDSGKANVSYDKNSGQTMVSPTVMSDSNIRENVIPNLNQSASSLGVTPQSANPNVSGANGFNASGGTGGDAGNGTEQPVNGGKAVNPYTELYKSILGDTTGMAAGTDPTTQAELGLIQQMRRDSDSSTASQLDSISAGYATRKNWLADSQNKETKNVAHALLMSGSRFTPVSSSAIMSIKEAADVQSLVNLDNEERAAKAAVYKAQQEQNYQLMSKQLGVLEKVRDSKIAMATTLANQMKDYNNYLLEVNKFNHAAGQDKIANEQKAEQLKQGKYEFRDLKDEFGNTIGTQVFDKTIGKSVSAVSAPGLTTAAPGSKGMLNPVQINSDGQVDTDQQAAFLKSLPPPIATTVVGLTNYTTDPRNISMKGNTRQKFLEYAHMYDPTYDETQYTGRSKFNTSWQSGGMASSNNAINTASQHLGELYTFGEKLNNVDGGGKNVLTLSYNDAKNWMAKHAGDADVTNFNTALGMVAAEVAKAYKNGVNSNAAPSKDEIEDMKKQIWDGSSGKQISGFVQTTLNMLNDKANVNEEQYTQIMGKPSKGVYLPTTLEKMGTLKDKGLELNIPGVQSSIGSGISKALGAGYKPEDILGTISKNYPEYAAKIKAARDSGIDAQTILNYLNQ